VERKEEIALIKEMIPITYIIINTNIKETVTLEYL